MPETIAIAREDGWAFVRTEKGIALVRPPYVESNVIPVDEQTVEKAVGTHGFVALREQFSTWKKLIAFLDRQVAEFRESVGKALPESGLGKRALEFADMDVIVDFMDRVENELLPNRHWDHAAKVLLAILGLPKVRGAPDLCGRAVNLMVATANAKASSEEARRRLAANRNDGDKISPLANQRYGDAEVAAYANAIAERGQTFAFG